MTQFDGSTPITSPSATDGAHAVGPADTPPQFGDYSQFTPASLLDQLRDAVNERDAAEGEPWVHTIGSIGVRIVCDSNIDNSDYQRWVKASMPRAKGRRVNPMDMDQLQLSARAIVHTNQRVELYDRQRKDYVPITDQGGTTLTALDKELLSAFNVVDPIELLRKLFGRDAALIDAGNDLLTAAGYLDGGDDEDPI